MTDPVPVADRPRLVAQWRALVALSDRRRPAGFLVLAALAVGLPAFVGAWLGQLAVTLPASMGGLVILYMPRTSPRHNLATLALCSLGFIACYGIGALTSGNDYLSAVSLAVTVWIVTFTCRTLAIPPPGSFLFILVACVGRAMPFSLDLLPDRVGSALLGCLGACVLGLIYSLPRGNRTVPARPAAATVQTWEQVALDTGVIAVFVGGGYLLALQLALDNPYWVPISCAAVLQGASFRDVWQRKVHRVVGTVLGMALAWVLFSLAPGPWVLAALITTLSFVIELLVTRNYGLAVIFITPLTLILADSAAAHHDVDRLILARLLDTVFGCTIGYLGGWAIHKRHTLIGRR